MPHSRIIPVDIDKRFRWSIVEFARIASLPETLVRAFETLLEEPDSRPNSVPNAQLLDDMTREDVAQMLARTAKVITALTYFHQEAGLAFVNWLGKSGWGNDVRLIKLFDAWAQEVDQRKRLGKTLGRVRMAS